MRNSFKIVAVTKGRKPGVYFSIEEAETQCRGWPGGNYKSFDYIEDAYEYFELQTGKRLNSSEETEIPPLF